MTIIIIIIINTLRHSILVYQWTICCCCSYVFRQLVVTEMPLHKPNYDGPNGQNSEAAIRPKEPQWTRRREEETGAGAGSLWQWRQCQHSCCLQFKHKYLYKPEQGHQGISRGCPQRGGRGNNKQTKKPKDSKIKWNSCCGKLREAAVTQWAEGDRGTGRAGQGAADKW